MEYSDYVETRVTASAPTGDELLAVSQNGVSRKLTAAQIAALAAGNTNASETVKGISEEATQAQTDAGTAVGETGARLFVNPAKLLAFVPTTVVNASETVKGIVEETTGTELLAGTATGATGAKLFITPEKFVAFRTLVRQSAAVSSGTMTLNLASRRECKFVNTTTQSSNFTIAFSNDSEAEIFTCGLFITGAVVITMPSSVVMEEEQTRWANGGKTLTLTGGTASPFVLSFLRLSSTLYECRATYKIFTA